MALDILGNTWNISQQGQDVITENNTIKDRSTILQNALNSDLKEIGSPVLAKILTKNSISQVVLQIQKIRNISAPKANENSHVAPRMLKLVLTDGDTYIQAIETSPIPTISYDKTCPGTKILIHSAKICSGYLLLGSNNCSVLGGRVPSLYEKWELAKSVQHHNRQNSSSDGPPAWVNFGCKIISNIQDKQFKSLDNKSQDGKENSKFDLQRQDAIAEATSGAVKKVFGGGIKQPVQTSTNYKKNESHNKEKKNHKKSNNTKEIDEKPQKPSERVSLFDFLEDKLPVNEINTEQIKPVVNDFPKNVVQNNQQKNRYNHNNLRVNNSPKPQPQKIEPNTCPPTKTKPKVGWDDVNSLANNFGKMSFNSNSQFASRSLRQHLNLGPQKKSELENNVSGNWRIGDDCLAKYWEDGKYYNATITAITDKTYVVKFKGYGNIEEVLKVDCLPVASEETQKRAHTGSMEFRRNTRTYRRQ